MINHLHHVSLKHFKCVSISCKWHCEDELKVKVNESIVPFPFPSHCSFPKTLNFVPGRCCGEDPRGDRGGA